jgi:ABC-2 type transport system permease protein
MSAPTKTEPVTHTTRSTRMDTTSLPATAPTVADVQTTSTRTARRSTSRRRPVRLSDVVRSEWIKFRSVRSTRLTLLVAGVATVGLGMIFAATASSGDAAPARAAVLSDPVQLALGAIDLTAMLVGVLGVLIIAGEYSTGLIRTTIAAVGDRLALLWAKAAVLATTTAVVMGITTVLALWLGQAVYRGDLPTMPLSDPGTFEVVLGTTTYVVGVALIGLALGFIVRSTASAIGILVGGMFIGPPLLNLLPDFFSDVVLKYLPSEAGSAIMATVSDPDLLSTGTAYAVFAAWVVGLLVVAGVLMRTRDA